MTVHLPRDLAERCRQLAGLSGAGRLTPSWVAARAVAAGLDRIERELRAASDAVIAEHDPEGL